MGYFKDRAGSLKEEIKELLSDDTELFLKDYYALCYNNFLMFESDKRTTDGKIDREGDYGIIDAEGGLNALLEFKNKIDNTPCIDVKSYSSDNHHWYVSDIFKIKPKRYGVPGDDIIWEYLEFYFELHSISLDVVPVEYIIEKAREVLCIYTKYAKHYEKDVLWEYWDEALEGLIRARYKCMVAEMELLK